jgi:hypothetical protein
MAISFIDKGEALAVLMEAEDLTVRTRCPR